MIDEKISVELKKLKMMPSLKEKRHYLVIKPFQDVVEQEFLNAVDKALIDFLGIFNYAKAGPLYIEVRRDYILLSVTTKYVNEVKAALSLSKTGKCIGVSGTIKKSRRFSGWI